MHAHKQREHGTRQVEGYCAFSPDGSKFDLPRTQANKRAFRRAGRKNSPPQLLLTLRYHLGTGWPWDWQVTAGKGSERAALKRMVKSLPKGALLVADAGFVGCDLIRRPLGQGLHVLIRAGGNVHLLHGLERAGAGAAGGGGPGAGLPAPA